MAWGAGLIKKINTKNIKQWLEMRSHIPEWQSSYSALQQDSQSFWSGLLEKFKCFRNIAFCLCVKVKPIDHPAALSSMKKKSLFKCIFDALKR